MKMSLGIHVILAAAACLQGSVAFATSSTCFSVPIKEKPRWISGAVLSENPTRLIVVDPVQNKLFAYSPSGKRESPPSPKLRQKFEPTTLSKVGANEFLLEQADGSLIRINKTLATEGPAFFPQSNKVSGDYEVGSFFQWQPVGGDKGTIVAYGSLIKGDRIDQGFFRVSLRGKQAPEMLTPLKDKALYVLGNPYIATIGDTAYYLAMEKQPAIYRAQSGRPAEKLDALPDSLRNRPDFKTPFTGPTTAEAHFAELETFTVASGLYAQNELLYVLGRRPEGNGRTAWFLYAIDPKQDKIVGPTTGLRLPTTANHLTVVPSDKMWFVIERSRVGARQSQDIGPMLMIPNEAIKAGQLPSFCLRASD